MSIIVIDTVYTFIAFPCMISFLAQTAAFALPILERLAEDPYGIFAVVLTAGRELAQQIADQFVALGSGMTLRVAVVTGGADMMLQTREVRLID